MDFYIKEVYLNSSLVVKSVIDNTFHKKTGLENQHTYKLFHLR